jgi:hypothetical protein
MLYANGMDVTKAAEALTIRRQRFQERMNSFAQSNPTLAIDMKAKYDSFIADQTKWATELAALNKQVCPRCLSLSV